MTDSPQADYAATITIHHGNLSVEDEQPKLPVLDGRNFDPLYVMPQTRRRLFEIPRELIDTRSLELTRIYLNKRVRVIVTLPHASCVGWLAAIEESMPPGAVRLTIVDPEDIDEQPQPHAEVYIGKPGQGGWQHIGTTEGGVTWA